MPRWPWLYFFFGFLAACLAGCSPTLSIPSAPAPPPQIIIHTSCLPLKFYPPAFSAKLLAEYKKLPPDSTLALVMLDYESLRDADRACLGQTAVTDGSKL